MQNNFNNTINQLPNFSIEPSPQNWIDIESHLPKKSNKKILVYWWHIPVLVSLSFLFIVYSLPKNNTSFLSQNNILIKKNNARNTIQKIIPNPIKQENSLTPKNIKNQNTLTIKPARLSKKNNFITATKKTISEINNFNNLQKINENIIKKTSQKNIDLKEVAYQIEEKKLTNTIVNNFIQSKDSLPKKDSSAKKIIIAISSQNDTFKKDNIIKNVVNKKLQYSMELGCGANYLSSNNIFGLSNNSNEASFSNSGTTNSGLLNPQNNVTNLPLFNTGSSVIIGANVELPLSKKIAIKSGLHYNYLKNNISVNNNTQNIDNLNFGNQYIYKNTLHIIAIPINMGYCINPNATNKITFLGGIHTGFVIKNNWLFLNNNTGNYEKNNNQINPLIFGLQTGIDINFKNKFSIGLQATKTVSAIQKTSSKYYLQQINFLINIPFKSQKK